MMNRHSNLEILCVAIVLLATAGLGCGNAGNTPPKAPSVVASGTTVSEPIRKALFVQVFRDYTTPIDENAFREDVAAFDDLCNSLQVGGFQVDVLREEHATRRAVLRRLTDMCSQVTADGTLILGLAGQGFEDASTHLSHFCLHVDSTLSSDSNDSHIADDHETVSLDDILAVFGRSSVANRVIIVGCGTPRTKEVNFASSLVATDLPSGTSLIVACAAAGSLNGDDLGIRVFLKGLSSELQCVGPEQVIATSQLSDRVAARLLTSHVGNEKLLQLPGVRHIAPSSVDIALMPEPPQVLEAPFPSTYAMKMQHKWAFYLGEPVVYKNSLGMEMALIPPGKFQMGSSIGDPTSRFAIDPVLDNKFYEENEQPPHEVRLSSPFRIGRTEVTVGHFRRFVAATGYLTDAERDYRGGVGWNATKGSFVSDVTFSWSQLGFPISDDFPVVNVSWNDTAAFIEWLSREEGIPYRLPTEAEWEYACRAGTTTDWWHGNDLNRLFEVANVLDRDAVHAWEGSAHEVAKSDGDAFLASVGCAGRTNPFGLSDMHGNAAEWCKDFYEPDFYTKGKRGVNDPCCLTPGPYWVVRGGSFKKEPISCRSSFRWIGNVASSSTGFRVAAQWKSEPARKTKCDLPE